MSGVAVGCFLDELDAGWWCDVVGFQGIQQSLGKLSQGILLVRFHVWKSKRKCGIVFHVYCPFFCVMTGEWSLTILQMCFTLSVVRCSCLAISGNEVPLDRSRNTKLLSCSVIGFRCRVPNVCFFTFVTQSGSGGRESVS